MDRNKSKSTERDKALEKDNAEVDPIIGAAVGAQLKSLFDEFASENVPDRFADLIGQLEQQEAGGSSASSSDDHEENEE